MPEPLTLDEFYEHVERFAKEMYRLDYEDQGKTILHRMRHVSWNSNKELARELTGIFLKLKDSNVDIPAQQQDNLDSLLAEIEQLWPDLDIEDYG